MVASAIDPYAPPEEPLAVTADQRAGEILRDGKYLIVRSGAVLPDICPVTAQPLPPGAELKRRTLLWIPPWAYLCLLTGVLAVVFFLGVQKRGTFTFGVSKKEQDRRKRTIRQANLCFVGAHASTVLEYFFHFRVVWPLVLTGVLIVLGVMRLVSAPSLRTVAYRKGDWFKLRGCSPEFLDTLPAVKFEDLS